MSNIIVIISLLAIAILAYLLLKAREDNARLKEQNRLITEEQNKLRGDSQLVFRDVASQLLNLQAQSLKESNEQRIGEILNPFKDNLDSLKKSIDSYRTQQVSYTAALQQQIKDLSDVNKHIGKEAQELSQALRGNSKTQGDWGELMLKQILDASGLQEGINYVTQPSRNANGSLYQNEEGNRLRPDVIFNLPDHKQLIIDAKVSLTAYADYMAAEHEEERLKALARHIASVKKHVDELAGKEYQRHINGTADFVMMFIPNEPAYLLAMSHDQSLWQHAFKRQVVIVSPTHLISVIKLIEQLWSRDLQTKNALNIADEAGKMYNKLADFVGELQNIEKALANAQKSCEGAWKKLSTGTGNLMKRAEKIKELGAKATKQLPNNPT